MDYAKVAVNLPLKNLFRQFTYKVPPSLDFIGEGWRVVVPFGRQLLEGFIVEADEAPDASLAIKSIVDVVGTEPWLMRRCWELPLDCPVLPLSFGRGPAAFYSWQKKHCCRRTLLC